MTKAFKLVAFDIDDTLIGIDGRIAPDDLAAIHRCMDEGIEVILVTGRTRPTTLPIAEQIGRPMSMICGTGGVIYAEDGRILQRLTVPLSIAKEILHRMREDDVPVRVDADRKFIFTHRPPAPLLSYDPVVEPDIADRLATAPDQIVVFGREETEWVIKQFSYLQGDVQLLVLPSHDEPNVVHILHPRATKGAALADYCHWRGIRREETVAFGDSLNDFTMLSYAGLGVAVADSEARLRLGADKVMTPGETLADVLSEYVLA